MTGTPLPSFIGATMVAKMLDYPSTTAFLRQRRRLEETMDFPPPVALQLKALRWCSAAVQTWIDLQAARPPAYAPARSNVVQLRVM